MRRHFVYVKLQINEVGTMFEDRLQMLREQKGMSKKEIASILGIHETTYGKYELGHREPDNAMINQLADYFNVTSDYLLGRTDNLTPKEIEGDEKYQTDEDLVFLSRNMHRLTPEKRKMLVAMFKAAFIADEAEREAKSHE